MNSLNSDLILLENLSKKISDLIFDKSFSQVLEIDAQRKLLIKKIKENQTHKSIIKKRIGKLVENNNGLIEDVEKKIQKLSKNHNKFNKRLKAYSFNK
jgi:seryl-tRNA synthetase